MNKRFISWFFLVLLLASLLPVFTPGVNAAYTQLEITATANGSIQTLNYATGGPTHWEIVEAGTNMYVGNSLVTSYLYDTYVFQDHTTQAGVIQNVTITGVFWKEGVNNGNAKAVCYIGGTPYYGSEKTVSATTPTMTWQNTSFTTNPATGIAWTWADIDNTQFGMALKAGASSKALWVYQNVYVYYTPALVPITNAATSVTETTATLNGVATGADGMTCGFWYNYSGSAKTNVTCAGTYNNGIPFSKDVVGLTANKKYTCRAWAIKTGIGYFNGTNSTFYTDITPPSIVINFAGNLSDMGGPYYRPPKDGTGADILDEAGEGIWRDGYYINSSIQKENWIYINLTVTDAGMGLPLTNAVRLDWYSQTTNTWTNTSYFTHTTGNYYEYNKTGVAAGKYSFNIRMIDNASNVNITWWNKTALGGAYTRRYVNLSGTYEDVTYRPLYIYGPATVPLADTQKWGRLQHDKGAAGFNDTGYIRFTIPTDTIQNTRCGSSIGDFFDSSVCAQPFTLTNVYFHHWYSVKTGVTQMDTVGWRKMNTGITGGPTDSYVAVNSESKSSLHISDAPLYDTGFTNNFNLTCHLLTTTPTTFCDNDIYEFVTSATGANDRPYFISNRSYTSFVLLNVPSNATLNASYVDSDHDLMNDWDELYRNYTNPFLQDTDGDGWNDTQEIRFSFDPNNYTSGTIYSDYVPGIPTSVTNTTWGSGASLALNITWVKGVSATADNTTIVRNTAHQPTTPTDGTIIYNSSGTYYNDTGITSAYYYTLYSWNATSHLFSPGVNLTWWVFWLNCYNESSGAALTNWNVFISNASGSKTYLKNNCNNSLIVSTGSMPTGVGCTISFSRQNYTTRVYTQTITATGTYTINGYLARFLPPDIPPTNTSYLYLLTVIDGSYDGSNNPVSDVLMTVKRYVNGSYVSVTSGLTDGYGQFSCYLVPGTSYKFFMSKTGYEDQIADWIPSTSLFTHTFQIYFAAAPPIITYYFYEEIHIDGYLNNATKTLYVNYTDDLTQTINIQVYVYEINISNTTSTLFYTYTSVGVSSFTFNIPVNNTNSYEVVFTLNHTYFEYKTGVLFFRGYHAPLTSMSRFNALFAINFGFNPFGWSNFIVWFIMLGVFFMPDGRKNTWIVMFVGGFLLLFLNYYIGFNTTMSVVAGGAIPVLMIVFGILMLIRDRARFAYDYQ